VPDEQTRELLIEVPPDWNENQLLPEWRGLRLQVLTEEIRPHDRTRHLCLSLAENGMWDVFLHFAADLVTSLEGVLDPSIRIGRVAECLDRWNSFFEERAATGLAEIAQRGLIAELLFIERLLDAGFAASDAVNAWKGCRRSYHDFDISGRVVEVKSTMTKEPRRVWISNERQLDDRGLESLHLFVVTFQPSDGGKTLPDVVDAVRLRLASDGGARAAFGHCLTCAGYSDSDRQRYLTGYAGKSEEVFAVRTGFPRIIDVSGGVGDLRYSVVLGACQEFTMDLRDVLSKIREHSHA